MRREETQIILGEQEKLSFLLCYLALVHLHVTFSFNFNETHGFIILVDNLLYPSFKGYL
jgi:hypothetical protein